MPAKRSSTTRSRVQCSKCEKTFRGPFELKRHSILHSSDKSNFTHKCPFPDCPYAALQKSNLKTHINSLHLKIRSNKCIVDPDVCQADFSDASSPIRHEKAIHRFYRKEGEFRRVEPVGRKTRTKRSTDDDEIAEPLTQEQLTAMPSSGSLLFMSPSPSPSTSTSPSSDNSSGYSPSPSPDLPSPDLPSPDALQLEYPQYFMYPDASFAPMPVAGQPPLDPAIYSTQAPQFYTDASYYDLSAPEFVQGCSSSSYSAMAPSTQETYYGSLPPYLSESELSFGLRPPSYPASFASSEATEAKVEWSSFLPAPVLAEIPSYCAPEFPTLNAVSNNLLDISSNAMFSSVSGFANLSSEFDSFMEEFGM